MGKSRKIGIIITGIMCIMIIIAGMLLSQPVTCRVEDAEGNLLGLVRKEQGNYSLECEDNDWAYVDMAFHEAMEWIADEENLTLEEARTKLMSEGVSIRTYCQKEIQEAIWEIMNESEEISLSDSAGAVSDIDGRLLACYSYSGDTDEKNHVIYPKWAGSTMKPFSVYAPALEEGMISWSSMEEDSAYTQIQNAEGDMTDWPVNTNEYTYDKKTMAQAIKESNNAIAVKVLKKFGVENSLDYLQNKLGYTVDREISILQNGSEDEVLDNVALGYVEAGVTMKQILESYQVFASGGVRKEIHAVEYIEGKNGIWQRSDDESVNRVFSEDTAYIINRMLKGVVNEGGTGHAAFLSGVDICGKTGTSSNYKDNWFIGMTPNYLCSVWYQCEIPERYLQNEAVSICRDIIKRLPDQEGLEFTQPETVRALSYCRETGFLAGEQCEETETGYYKVTDVPQICDCTVQVISDGTG